MGRTVSGVTPPLGLAAPRLLVGRRRSVYAWWVYCTSGRRCGSLTISAGTSCGRCVNMGTRPARLWSWIPLDIRHRAVPVGSAFFLRLSTPPHCSCTVPLCLAVSTWTDSSRRLHWAWRWTCLCPVRWRTRWAADGRYLPLTYHSLNAATLDHRGSRYTIGMVACNLTPSSAAANSLLVWNRQCGGWRTQPKTRFQLDLFPTICHCAPNVVPVSPTGNQLLKW